MSVSNYFSPVFSLDSRLTSLGLIRMWCHLVRLVNPSPSFMRAKLTSMKYKPCDITGFCFGEKFFSIKNIATMSDGIQFYFCCLSLSFV